MSTNLVHCVFEECVLPGQRKVVDFVTANGEFIVQDSIHFLARFSPVFRVLLGKPSKKKSVDFSTPPRYPPLKCGNTFLGEKNFHQFYPENDLPTHKNWMKWDKIL